MIDLIDTRDTKKVNEVLKQFSNLKIISRDRGVQYRNINDRYIHITDHFYLIANLSDLVIEKLKNTLPKIIKIKDDKTPFIKNSNKLENYMKNKAPKSILIPQQKRKLEIKSRFNKGISLHQIALYYEISRNTVRKYVRMGYPLSKVQNNSRRTSILFLGTIHTKIVSLCN